MRAALQADGSNRVLLALEVRVWGALGEADSARAAAERWIALDSGSAEPYREWAGVASRRGDLTQARRVLADGARRLGDQSLTQDLAQVSTLAGDWIEAARQWLSVASANPAMIATASAHLSRAPPAAPASYQAAHHEPAGAWGGGRGSQEPPAH